MGVFQKIKPRRSNQYIQGAEIGAISESPEEKYTGLLKGIKLAENGTILRNNEPIEIKKDFMIVFPEIFTSYGFPQTYMAIAGNKVSAQSALWSLLADEERAGMIEHLNEEDRYIKIRIFKDVI